MNFQKYTHLRMVIETRYMQFFQKILSILILYFNLRVVSNKGNLQAYKMSLAFNLKTKLYKPFSLVIIKQKSRIMALKEKVRENLINVQKNINRCSISRSYKSCYT